MWHFDLLMTTLRDEMFKMKNSLRQTMSLNTPKSERTVPISSI